MAAYTLQGKTESGDVVDIPLAATCDANGKVISDTYATKTEVNAKATTAALNEVKNTATNAASTANEAKTAADKAITGFDTPSFKFNELPVGSKPTGSATITGDNSAKKFNFTFGIPAIGQTLYHHYFFLSSRSATLNWKYTTINIRFDLYLPTNQQFTDITEFLSSVATITSATGILSYSDEKALTYNNRYVTAVRLKGDGNLTIYYIDLDAHGNYTSNSFHVYSEYVPRITMTDTVI